MPAEPSERRVLYHQNKESGYCPRCGIKKSKKEKHSYCEDCRTYFRNYFSEISVKQNKARQKKYELRKKNNQCPRCGKKLGKRYTKTICPVCLEKQYKYNSGNKKPAAKKTAPKKPTAKKTVK
jgi:NMD protein affecting ribosome stability and mRNA decay